MENGSPTRTPICGNFPSIPTIPGVNPSTGEVILNPGSVEVILNPDTLEATLDPETLNFSLTHPETSPNAPILSNQNQAALNTSAETRTGVECCELSPTTSKIKLAHSSVSEVHLEIQPPADILPDAKSKVHEEEKSVQYGGHLRNDGDADEEEAAIPGLSFKSSSLVYVSDFTEDSDNVHADDGRRGGYKEQEMKNCISTPPIGATNNNTLDKTALENESMDTRVNPTEVRDEIEDFDEKVALVKAKLDLENSEEARAVEAVMAGLKERYSESRGLGCIQEDEEKVVVEKHVMSHSEESKAVDAVTNGLKDAHSEDIDPLESGEVNVSLEDGKVDTPEEAVVERHVEECIESVIEQVGRGNIVKAIEDDVVEGYLEGIGHKAKRKLRRQRWSWL